MLILPNKAIIDEDGLYKALSGDVSKETYCLDILTGQVGIFKKGKNTSQAFKPFDKDRYFEIPKISEKMKLKWGKEFVKEIVGMEDAVLKNRFFGLMRNRKVKFADFYKLLEKSDLHYGWSQWKYDQTVEERDRWLDTLPIEIEDNWEDELDDDCPLCQLLKHGGHTVEDFKEAAKKLKKRE